MRNKAYLNKSLVFIKRNFFILMMIIPTFFLLFFLVIPLISLMTKSVISEGGLTLEYFGRYFSSGLYLKVMLNTFTLSFLVSILCMLMGYPVAYIMNKASTRMRLIIMSIVQISFWTSLLVRAYAWTVMLQNKGVLNSIFIKLGIINEPIQMLHNSIGVICGMTYIMLPFMIFSIYSVMSQINNDLLTASESLGGSHIRTFLQIFFPLTMPGVVAGFTLVFLNSIGYYIVPSLLGGEKNTMISQLIQTQISKVLNWNFAAAVSIILILATIVIMLISQNLSRVRGREE